MRITEAKETIQNLGHQLAGLSDKQKELLGDAVARIEEEGLTVFCSQQINYFKTQPKTWFYCRNEDNHTAEACAFFGVSNEDYDDNYQDFMLLSADLYR